MKKTVLLAFCMMSCMLDARMVTVNSVEDFNKLYQGDTPLVTMYSAPWCGPCKQMKPDFHAVADATQDIVFCIIDVDTKAFAPLVSNIRHVPTIKFSHKGKQTNQTNGLSKKQLEEALKELRTKIVTSTATQYSTVASSKKA
jgi:thioredoxin 1